MIFTIFIPSAQDIQRSLFLMQIQDMDHNSFFSGMIKHEAIHAWANAYRLKSLCGKPVMI